MNEYIRKYTNPRHELDQSDADKVAKRLREDAVIEDGVIRWKSNGNVLFDDLTEFAAFLGLPVDREKTRLARDTQIDRSLSEYRKREADRQPSDEELFEMEAAFGKGATVENIITGQKIKL